MISPTPVMLRAARYLTFGSVVSVLFSIAVSQTLLALALVALLISGEKLRLPPIWLPLGIFLGGTLVSLALSDHPSAANPQVRKIFVFITLVVVFSTFRDLAIIRRLLLCSVGVGALVALRALVQFAEKLHQSRELGQNFYEYYVTERITGFMSHWMTFGGQDMFVCLILAAYLFFSPEARKRGLWFWLLCGAILVSALILGFTRSIWLASAAAGLYLLWSWRRAMVLIAPLALLVGFFVAPDSVRERGVSLFQPRKDLDSNQHRIVTWRTGLRMIQEHPWLGLGPEGVNLKFYDYVPPDVPRPLPSGWYGHLHNIYLHYAAERGIPVMLALVWLLIKILVDFLRQIRQLPRGRSDARFVLHSAVAVVIATMVGGMFELNLGDSEVLAMFLAIVSCGYVAVGSAKAKSIAQQPVAT